MFWLIVLFIIFSKSCFATPIIKITNFSSNTLPEWIEIHNETSSLIDLTNWKIGDSNTSVIYDINLSGCLSANSYLTIYQTSALLNNDGDSITIYDNNNIQIDQLIYANGKTDNTQRSDNTCIPSITPTQTPSPTPTVTNTPTPTNTSTPTNTPSPTNTPTLTNTPTSTITPKPTVTQVPLPTETPYIEPTPTVTSPEILGVSDLIITPTLLPQQSSIKTISPALISAFFIISGCLLLFVPLIILKLKK